MNDAPSGARSIPRIALGIGHWALGIVMCVASGASAAQTLLDRVVARVGSAAVTLSDVRGAVGLGVIPAGDEPLLVEMLVQRHILLDEVQRFPPPEPTALAIEAEAARLRARPGTGLAALVQSTGLDEARIRALAGEDLRIQAYLDLRFGTSVQVTDEEVEQYYRTHPEEFTRDGALQPFNDVQALARQRASTLRRQVTIDQWMRDLRARADVTITAR